MARGPLDKYTDENLGPAIGWIRKKVGLKQPQVAEHAQELGHELSVSYLSECERGVKQPSKQKLEVILESLGCNQEELEEILIEKPWDLPANRDYSNYSSPTKSRSRTSGFDVPAQPLGAFLSQASDLEAKPTREQEAQELSDIFLASSRSNQLTMLSFARNISRDK